MNQCLEFGVGLGGRLAGLVVGLGGRLAGYVVLEVGWLGVWCWR